MNILMMVSWFGEFAGEEKEGGFHFQQAVELNKYCNCAIYYPYDRFIHQGFKNREENGIIVYRSKYCLKNKVRNRYFMFQAMRKIVEEFHPDIIHGNVATESGRFAAFLGKLFHIPVMITEHSSTDASGVDSFPHYYYAKYAYRHSRYNACVSDCLRDNLKKIFPQYTFHTVYNGIPEICVSGDYKGYRKEGYVNVGMIAGFYNREIKGVQFVLPALRKMIDKGYSVFLHIIGGGKFLSEYMEMAKSLNLENNCIFYGSCVKDKLFSIEKELDFIVSASIFESFGCAVAEAALLGKPIVASKSGGVESIVNSNNGILVERGSVDSIFDGMTQMYKTYKNFNTNQIVQDASGKFSIDIISRKYIEIYNEILNNN